MGDFQILPFVDELVSKNPLVTTIGAGAVGLGVGVAAGALLGGSSSSKARKTRRSGGRDRKFISKQRHEASRKRKRPAKIYGRKGKWYSRTKRAGASRRKMKSSGRKVYYARKTGQPYIKLASGKARFIKGKRRKR